MQLCNNLGCARMTTKAFSLKLLYELTVSQNGMIKQILINVSGFTAKQFTRNGI